MRSLMRAPQPSRCDFFLAFYARRLKRLTPALAAFVAFTTLLVPLLMGADSADSELSTFYTSAQLSTVGGANILFAMQTSTYWDTTVAKQGENPFLHCWSLCESGSRTRPASWYAVAVIARVIRPLLRIHGAFNRSPLKP